MDLLKKENETTIKPECGESNNHHDNQNNNHEGDEDTSSVDEHIKQDHVYEVMGREEQELARRQYPDDDLSSEVDQEDKSCNVKRQNRLARDDSASPRDSCESGSQIYDSNGNSASRTDDDSLQFNNKDHFNHKLNHSNVNGANNMSETSLNGNDGVAMKNRHSDEPEQMRKLFIGGLDYKTSESVLKQHFEQFGEVIDCVVMREPQTKRSRGFGFVIYKHSSMVDRAQNARPHEVEGREVQSKRAISREDSGKPEAQATVKKVYLGGISDDIEESELRSYFKEFGNIVNINIVTHKDTGKRRGFAFAEFDDYDPVDKIVLRKFHTIKEKRIEAKKAIPKNEMDARKRVDPRMSMPGNLVPGQPMDGPRSRSSRGANDGCLWDGPYGGNYAPGYGAQTNYGYPAHPYHSSPSHYGAGHWILSSSGGSGGGGPSFSGGSGFRGPHSASPYGRNSNYNPSSGNWANSTGSDYGFPPVPSGVASASGNAGGPGGPIRLTHQYRWGPYGGGYGGTHRGRGYNS